MVLALVVARVLVVLVAAALSGLVLRPCGVPTVVAAAGHGKYAAGPAEHDRHGEGDRNPS